MNTKYIVGIFACLSILVTACGSSSSNDDGNTQLQTEDQALDSFCLNFPTATACQTVQDEAGDMGFDDYFGGNDNLYGDSGYNGGAGMCGCQQGQRPIVYGNSNRYVRGCEPEQYERYTRDETRYRYTRRHGRESLEYERVQEEQETYRGGSNGSDNCYEAAGRRCNLRDPYACQNGGSYGNGGYNGGYRDQCVRVPGTGYGYCQSTDRSHY